MPSVEAAARLPAPIVQAESARLAASLPDSVAGSAPRNQSDFFSALFVSARLARQRREDAAQDAQEAAAQDQRAQPSEGKAELREQRPESAESPPDRRIGHKSATRRDRLERAAREDTPPTHHDGRPSSAPAAETQEASAAEPSQEVVHEASAEPAEDSGRETSPAASSTQSSGQTDPRPAVGFLPLISLPSSTLVSSTAPAATGPSTATNAVLLSLPGDPSQNVSPVVPGSPAATVEAPLSGSTAGTGTETAGGHTSTRPNATGGTAEGGDSAKAAPSGGSFDHLLQAAARAKGQIAGRAGSNGIWRGPPEALRPADPGSVGELARIVRATGRDGQSKMLLRLDPPDLGQVRIDVRMHEQTLTLRMETQTRAGHDALQSRLGELKSALEQQGVQVQHMEVELRTPPTPAPQEQAWQQQHGSPQDGATFGQSSEQNPGSQSRAPHDHPTAEPLPTDVPGAEMSAAAENAPWYARRLNLVA